MTVSPFVTFTGRDRVTLMGILVVITMIAFEAMAVGAALPTAARQLHATGSFGWFFTGYLAANIVGMVVAGQVSDSRGPRGPLIAGLAAFTGGLVISGAAPDMPVLVAGRCVQGVGGGLLITVVYVVMGQAFTDEQTPKVFTFTASAWVLPSLLGPVVSGVLAQHVNWRWVFLGLLPLAAAGWVLMLPVLRSLHRPDVRLEPRRAIPYAIGAAAGIAALEQVGQHPPTAPVLTGVAVVALALLGWALRALLPHGRPVMGPIILRGLLSGAFFGVEAVVPLSLQLQHDYGATLSGMPLACAGCAWAVGSWWQGRPVERDGTSRRVGLVRSGFSVLAAAALLVGFVSQTGSPAWLMYPAWALAGLGAGLAMSSFGVLLLRLTDDAHRGADSAALQLSDSTGSAVTTGVAGALVAAAVRGAVGFGSAFAALDVAMALVALLGLLCAGRLRARP